MANPAPVIGEWYRRTGGDSFEVVAIDPDDRTIEIQYFDGTIEEIELDDWLEEPIEATEAPEDWTGSVDVDTEDTENEYEAEPNGGENGAIRCSRSIAARWVVTRSSSCRISRTTATATESAARRNHRPRSAGSSSGTLSSSNT